MQKIFFYTFFYNKKILTGKGGKPVRIYHSKDIFLAMHLLIKQRAGHLVTKKAKEYGDYCSF